MSECQMDPIRLSALVDGELPADERQTLEAHVAECARCQSEMAALQAVRDGAGGLPDEPVAAGEWERVWSAIERGLPRRAPRRRPAGLTWRVWAWPRPVLAAAALVLALITGGLLLHGPRGGEGLSPLEDIEVATQGEVQVEWVSNDADNYMLVLTPPVEGRAPVLWVTSTETEER